MLELRNTSNDLQHWIPEGFVQRDVDVHGVRLSCAVGGAGKPMVLIHGWPQTGRAWRLVMKSLARKHTVVVPDIRGTGNSERPERGYRKMEQAEDMRTLLAGLGLNGPSVIVGHDIGAMIAYAWAAQYPKEVEAMVLMEALIPGLGLEAVMDPAKGGLFHFGLFMTPEVPELLFEGKEWVFMKWWFHRMTSVEGAITEEDVAAYAQSYSGKDRLRGGFSHYRALLEDGKDNAVLKQWPLTMPVLAIGGEKSGRDRLALSLKTVCEKLHSAIAPTGHFVVEEDPGWFLEELGQFLIAIL